MLWQKKTAGSACNSRDTDSFAGFYSRLLSWEEVLSGEGWPGLRFLQGWLPACRQLQRSPVGSAAFTTSAVMFDPKEYPFPLSTMLQQVFLPAKAFCSCSCLYGRWSLWRIPDHD